MGELTNPSRPYGEEHPGDFYEAPCAHECRLGCLDACRSRGACRLEVTPDRPTRARSAYLDNRRGIYREMVSRAQGSTTVRTFRGNGLPQNDPITVWVENLKGDDAEDPTPYYRIRAEGAVVDGPYRLTVTSLKVRIDDLAQKRAKGA